jgi:hypothetical protein
LLCYHFLPPDKDILTVIADCFYLGGHTQEMISLLATLPLERYTPRLYLYTQGDGMSLRKALEFEAKIAASDGAEAKGGRKVCLVFLPSAISERAIEADHVFVFDALYPAPIRDKGSSQSEEGWTILLQRKCVPSLPPSRV